MPNGDGAHTDHEKSDGYRQVCGIEFRAGMTLQFTQELIHFSHLAYRELF